MRQGITLMETILAFFIMAVAFVVLFAVFSGGYRAAVQSRNRTVAILYAQSLLEEVRAHPYGQPAPPSWTAPVAHPVDVIVEGRKQHYEFAQQVSYANSSFIGLSDQDADEVTITLKWREGVGNNPTQKELAIKTAVWR